jgi:hypothetical protein
MTNPKPSDYATRKEYRWAKKAAAKEQRAAIRPFAFLAVFPLMFVWIFTGSFVLGLVAAIGGSAGIVQVQLQTEPGRTC